MSDAREKVKENENDIRPEQSLEVMGICKHGFHQGTFGCKKQTLT